MPKSLACVRLMGVVIISSSGILTSVGATSISESVAQKQSREILIAQSVIDDTVNLKFESRGCRRIKTTQVSCDVVVTNLATERQEMRFSVNNSAIPGINAIDSSGTVHAVQRTQSGNGFSDFKESNGTACGCFNISLASGIPTKVTFMFEIPPEITEIAALDIGYWWYKDPNASGVSKRTALSKIGAIAFAQPKAIAS